MKKASFTKEAFLIHKQFFICLCFYINMNSVVNNSAINYQAANLGVLTVPDGVGKVQLYSDIDANKMYKALTNDVSQKQSKVKPGKTYKTPTAVLFTGGAAALAFLFAVCKKIIKK